MLSWSRSAVVSDTFIQKSMRSSCFKSPMVLDASDAQPFLAHCTKLQGSHTVPGVGTWLTEWCPGVICTFAANFHLFSKITMFYYITLIRLQTYQSLSLNYIVLHFIVFYKVVLNLVLYDYPFRARCFKSSFVSHNAYYTKNEQI